MIKIAILGHGVVGSGVMEVILKSAGNIAKKANEQIEVKYILDKRDFSHLPYGNLFVTEFDTILHDPEVTIVVEVLGGLHPAYDFTKALLENGKSVVTSNKEVVAEKGAELLNLARNNNLNYLFEASVGGGIPIIRPISQCLAANELVEISGILNGTTNYILTQMSHHGQTFEAALSEAQEKGYAERNPAADIEGIDSCRKICILTSLAFGKHIYPDMVNTTGISEITAEDVKVAESYHSVIKLLGKSRKLPNGKVSILVAPYAVPSESPLSNVEDVYNGILVQGDVIGSVMFYGRGAGKLPTASAVVADIIDEVKHIHARKYLCWEETSEKDTDILIEDAFALKNDYLIRVTASNKRAAAQSCKSVFEITEWIPEEGLGENTLGFLSAPISHYDFEAFKAKLLQADSVTKISGYRVLR